MNLIKNIILLSLSALFFASGCSTTNDIRVEEGITAEQRKIAIALAEEFGIEKIESITVPTEGTFWVALVVIGDEQLEDGIGRYKQLDISFRHTRFESEIYSGISPGLSACEMRVVQFVELAIKGYEKVRVLTRNVDPELALKLLTKIYMSDYTLAPEVDAKNFPSREMMQSPKYLYLWDNGDYHLHLPDCKIEFSSDEGDIVILAY